MATDAPPPNQVLHREQIECAIAAAVKYDFPANVLLAIAEQEAGKPNTWSSNRNGTYDVGVMQFNTAYLRQLQRYGIHPEHVASDTCYPYLLAAWRLKTHLVNDRGSFWTRISNYHSQTTYYNQKYAASVAPRAERWATWLEKNYATKEVNAEPGQGQRNADQGQFGPAAQTPEPLKD